MTRDYKKAVTGSNAQSSAMIFKTNAPLDDRTAVRCKGALISQTALGKNGTDSKDWLFEGLIACDRETGDLYTLYNKSSLNLFSDSALNAMSEEQIDAAIALGWKKMATKADISGLSGLWKFKGVAESISPDKDTIFINDLYITVSNDDSDSDYEEHAHHYKCIGFEYDIAHNVYFKWKRINSEQIVYTKPDDSINIYVKSSSPVTVLYVQNDEDLYFKTTATGGLEWERLSDGQHIYTKTEKSSTASNVQFFLSISDTNPVFTADIKSYSGNEYSAVTKLMVTFDGITYYFQDATDPYMWHYDVDAIVYSSTASGTPPITTTGEFTFYTSATPGEQTSGETGTVEECMYTGTSSVTASPENNGWVYQIEDKEYASNGTIWVELGSPKEDLQWLVIS